MRKFMMLAVGFLVLVLVAPGLVQAEALKVGDKAPEFALADQEGRIVKLSDFRGKKNVVLAFYVLAFTGG